MPKSYPSFLYVPYSVKLSRIGENTIFAEKTLRIARFCHAKEHHASSFTEKTFIYSHKTAKFAKVFHYMVPHEPAIAMACIDFYCGIISEQVFIRISVIYTVEEHLTASVPSVQ